MGDVHFIIRHGLTGFIFLVFLLFGFSLLIVVTDTGISRFMPEVEVDVRSLDAVTLVVTIFTTAFLTTPVIGVMVQGIHTAHLYWTRQAFADEARRQMKEFILKTVREQGFSDAYKQLEHLRADAMFVWLYHTHAEPQLIDWARRRRSYHYLGWNWVIATGCGFYFGFAAPMLWEMAPRYVTVLVFAALSGAWAIGTIYIDGT